MKKLTSVAVVLLFIGLAVAPSINANISKEALVEFITEVCGLNGGKHTVKLTQEEAEEVEDLFDSIREKLNASETREESEEIFKEAVVELDKYGLLGGLSIKQAQELVTGGFSNPKAIKFIERMVKKNIADDDINMFCNISGTTTYTRSRGFSEVISLHLPFFVLEIGERFWNKHPNLPDFLAALLFYSCVPFLLAIYIYGVLNTILPDRPINLGGVLLIGGVYKAWESFPKYYPGNGELWTDGTLGKKTWYTPIYGQFPEVPCDFGEFLSGPFGTMFYYPAVIGFTGIVIKHEDETSYLGKALMVKVGSKHPWF